jgi:cardiolipin synthase
MADALGSRDFIRGPRWRQLREAGVQLLASLEDIPRLGRLAAGRVDLRNHRKLVVIDNRVAFCGSQNCADPQFLVKAKYAPWIDVLLRCEGPVVRQAQHLFLATWIAETGEELYGLPAAAPEPEQHPGGVVAQMFGTGPTTPGNAMSDAFVSALYAAEHELIITTPYFVPDEALLRALCTAPRRGVDTTLIVPARNDSALVAAASRSTYSDLLICGVRLFEYPLGLLHTKTITIDGRIALVGSANMDRRSLELNFENNLLILDPGRTATIRERQLGYLSQSNAIEAAAIKARPFHTRLVGDVIGMASPLL